MKELIKTIVLVLLAVATVYLFVKIESTNKKMSDLTSADSLHLITINDFDHNLNDLSLEFIGRGKHIQQFQAALAQLDDKLDSVNQALGVQIENTNTVIAELKMDLDSRLATMKSDHDNLNERLGKFRRETNRTLTDIQSAISRMGREFGDLEKRVKTLETPPAPPKK